MQPKYCCLRPPWLRQQCTCVWGTGMLLLEFPESVLNWGEFAAANNVKGWLDASVPLCQWSGVQCDGDGRVTALCATPAARCAAQYLCSTQCLHALPG